MTREFLTMIWPVFEFWLSSIAMAIGFWFGQYAMLSRETSRLIDELSLPHRRMPLRHNECFAALRREHFSLLAILLCWIPAAAIFIPPTTLAEIHAGIDFRMLVIQLVSAFPAFYVSLRVRHSLGLKTLLLRMNLLDLNTNQIPDEQSGPPKHDLHGFPVG